MTKRPNRITKLVFSTEEAMQGAVTLLLNEGKEYSAYHDDTVSGQYIVEVYEE